MASLPHRTSGSDPCRTTALDGGRTTSRSLQAVVRRCADFFDAAVAAGAEVLHEPKEWPIYHPGYYGAFVRDPDGNNVEAVCHIPE